MSIYRRGSNWWVDFTTPGGERVKRSTGTSDKRSAQELHDKWKSQGWRQSQLGEKIARTWDEAALRWMHEAEANGKSDLEGDRSKLRWFDAHLSGVKLNDIDEQTISDLMELKRKDLARSGKPVTNGTLNRYLSLLRAILRKAHREWKWTNGVPVIKLLNEPRRRVRWITPEQVQLLLQQLPEHQQDMTLFALSTGLRQNNVKNLEWSQVDLNRRVMWIHGDQSKSGEPIGLPLNQSAMDVLLRQKGKHDVYVFTFKGKPVTQVNTYAWREGLKAAGITNFRWHDLRHTWATWLRMRGVPLSEIQDLGGWASEKMVKRYAHTDTQHLLNSATEIDKIMPHGTFTEQQERNGVKSVVSP